MKNETTTVQSVERALQILSCFTTDEPEQSIKMISTKLALPKSTVVRLLQTLKVHRFVEQHEHTQQYRLGFKLFELGNVYARHIDLRQEALTIMRALQNVTRETISLNILDRYERVCIEKVESNQNIRNFVEIGKRSELCFGASGRMLLSYLRKDEQQLVMEKEGLHTVEQQRVYAQIDQIVMQGFALTKGERITGLLSIAAPIFNDAGQVVAGLSLSGPIVRTKTNERELIERLKQAAHDISLRLGYEVSTRSYVRG